MPRLRTAYASWSDDALHALLAPLGLPATSPLSVLAVELLPEPNGGFGDPLGGDLGDVRILPNVAAHPGAIDLLRLATVPEFTWSGSASLGGKRRDL